MLVLMTINLFNAKEVILQSYHHLFLSFELRTKGYLVNDFSFPVEAGHYVTVMATGKMLSKEFLSFKKRTHNGL